MKKSTKSIISLILAGCSLTVAYCLGKSAGYDKGYKEGRHDAEDSQLLGLKEAEGEALEPAPEPTPKKGKKNSKGKGESNV